MSRGALLAVPAFGPGLGGGHLVRCTALVRGLRALGRDALLFFPSGIEGESPQSFFSTQHFDHAWIATEADLRDRIWECIILDRFRTPYEEYLRWVELAPVIAIDEGGFYRKHFDFLIDILPNINRVCPNIADPSLLPLPAKFHPRDAPFAVPLKILVSFGQEDLARLGPAVAEAFAVKLLPMKTQEILDVTLLRGGLGANTLETENWKQCVKVIETIPNLSERLCEYDLVITHFGLTSFEALYAGVPVLLLSPTKHHQKVARKAGFHSLGVGKNKAKKLVGMLVGKNGINHVFLSRLKNHCKTLATKHNVNHAPEQSLAELANGFKPDLNRSCPVCGIAYDTAFSPLPLARFSECTYRRCKHCGIIGMSRLTPPPIEYAREYFFEFYEKQYGKTYIDDFPNLIAMGKRRLAVIKSLLSARMAIAPTLFDIGCAYGPFLIAARDEGFSPMGLDPAEDAVRYVTQTLGLSATQGFFPCGTGESNRKYDVVTLWYVIEHFRDCAPVLAEIREMLKPGGVLAFATPSFSGVSGRCSLGRFLERSPEDHWTIWSPKSCKKALSMAGFKVKKVTVCGHHPERFPYIGKYARNRKGLLFRFLLAISKIFSFGDTFEVYAVKT